MVRLHAPSSGWPSVLQGEQFGALEARRLWSWPFATQGYSLNLRTSVSLTVQWAVIASIR